MKALLCDCCHLDVTGQASSVRAVEVGGDVVEYEFCVECLGHVLTALECARVERTKRLREDGKYFFPTQRKP